MFYNLIINIRIILNLNIKNTKEKKIIYIDEKQNKHILWFLMF